MTPERKYATGLALRTALEERLKRLAREEGVDLQRLRRQVAFDRFLARLFPRNAAADWILKGGYAMELRFQTARATRDLDFTVRAAQSVTRRRATQTASGCGCQRCRRILPATESVRR